MSIALRTAGFDNLRLCSDSREVMAMLAAETFCLVILDLNMPLVSGHDIIRQSAALENRPPIVVVTASSQIKDYAEGTAGGVVEYLVKPVDREKLIAAVTRALDCPSCNQKGRLARSYLISDRITSGSPLTESSTSEGIIDMLEQTRREYRRLIGSLPTPYVLLDEDSYRIRYCNEAFLRFIGADSPAAVEQLRFFDLLADEERTAAERLLRERGELRDVELHGRTPDGRGFAIVGSFRLSANDGFAEGGFVDVTEHKQLEQELARAHRLEAVGKLAAGLAHDFNNTLLVVSGFAELITSEEGVTEPVRGYAEEIHQAVAKASRMVQQLFSMSKPPARAHACIDLNAVLREAEASFRQHLRQGQSLVLSFEADNPLVDIPVSQLDQVVRNLVLNARDAMPAGGTITISTKKGTDPSFLRGSESVFLEIRDTGTGMDSGTLARIFEPFFTNKAKSEGTGLGLSMVQMIVEAAKGRILVESAPGRGTLFRITLPLAALAA